MKIRKEKVLFLLHLPPPIHGSSVVGKQIYDSELIRNAYNCVFLNLSTSTRVNTIGRISIEKFFIYFKLIFRIVKVLLLQNIDKVYMAPTVINKGFYKDLVLVLILKLFRKKIFFHLHNKGVSKRDKNYFNNTLYRLLFSNVHVILLSKLLIEDVSEFVKPQNISICPNGIKNKRQTIEGSIQGNKVPVILFLSNLIESKGVLVLLRACKILKERAKEFKCNFVGSEGDISTQIIQDFIKEFNLSDNVFYLGPKYEKDKYEVFLNSDIFTFPTYYECETFGLVNLEAMQFSLPIVSTKEGGIPDLVLDGKTGFLINRKDEVELANKLEVLIEDSDLRTTMGNSGRIHFEKNFTEEKFINTISTILSN